MCFPDSQSTPSPSHVDGKKEDTGRVGHSQLIHYAMYDIPCYLILSKQWPGIESSLAP